MANRNKWNALAKKALAFGLTQTKKQFQRLTLVNGSETDDEIVEATYKLEVSDEMKENREFIQINIIRGEILTRKRKPPKIEK